jgi:TonB family protein
MTQMIADPPRRTSLGVGFDGRQRGATTNREAWKAQIGTKPVPARLALLPEGKSNWGRVGVSAVLQLVLLTFFVLVPLLYPEGMKTAVHYYISTPLTTPETMVPVAPPPPPPKPVKVPKVEVKPPAPVEPVKLNPQQPHIFTNLVAPKVVQPKVEKVEAKALDVTPQLQPATIDVNTNGPKRPKDDVKVGNLGSAATPTLKPMPVEKVQTGGFGDNNGVAGKATPNHTANVNGFGSPALPGGPGYGNGTGGDKGARGVVPSTGFGNGTAIEPSGSGKKGTVTASNFGNAADMTAEAPKKKAEATGPADTPPEILDKPKPEYTTEGRNLKIEGDVRVSVVFLANGTIQVNRVVSGLGHGLDEAAVRAAQQIKFKPAKREGQPVDYPADLRIQFRLAY